jgi:nitroimidazol reductase NimA-like FMN-containing flavoprotein (pyridoxamine 5'-phosphate oxidase superfamily)
MEWTDDCARVLHELCCCQPLAVLATARGSAPYASLVAIAVTPDLRRLYFATPRATRKANNLADNPQVAFLFDNRNNQLTDFTRAAAATVLGSAEELHGADRASGLAFYLERHPHLAEFTASPGTVLFAVTVTRISLVTRFQQVMDYDLS